VDIERDSAWLEVAQAHNANADSVIAIAFIVFNVNLM